MHSDAPSAAGTRLRVVGLRALIATVSDDQDELLDALSGAHAPTSSSEPGPSRRLNVVRLETAGPSGPLS